MMNGNPRTLALLLATAGLLPGCAQQGSLLSQRTSLGSLKTSLSHLEFENGQLKRELARAKSESREFEDRLVREERANDDLKSRLDDARNLLSHHGEDGAAARLGPGPIEPAPARTLPAGRSNRKPRKPPFAQIPGRIDEAEPPAESPGKGEDLFEAPASPGGRDEFGPQSRLDNDNERWLPIAQGVGAAPPKKVR